MQTTHQAQSTNSITRILFFMIMTLATISHITADMYVPSLPAITKALATNPSTVQLTLSIYMLGFSVSHLFYGPISDRIGRRKPILFGAGLSVIGGLLCYLAPSISILILGRFIQGIGMGATNSITRSLMRDLFAGPHLAKIGSHLGMAMVFVIAGAPTLGGYVQYYFNWRANFLILFIYTTLIWVFIWKALPETNQNLNATATKLNVVARNYFILLKSKVFMGYTLCCSFAYAGLIAYVTSSPFLLQNVIGLTPQQFGWLSLLIGGCIFISSFINSKWVMIKGISFMLLAGIYLMLAGGSLMLILGLSGYVNIYSIMIPIMIFSTGVGFAFTNASAGAMHPFPKMAGSSAALYGCLQIFGGSLASALIATLHINNQIPLAWMLLIMGLLALVSFHYLAIKEEKNALNDQVFSTN